ncbi:hypothetical protein Nepgr_033589 [Nepenthes gracilis]|uniref:Uncharacterized protein n=1 Tax=Nepenthes gracilis TaxID=150966 RepID=A0AAD3TKQ5_NEPGR|nr:hypothetical protein Nepgr_033589 [Nepenthes gracilis]
MLGAPGFGGNLIGCECFPGLLFTLAAEGGHALRANVPAGFAGAADSYVLSLFYCSHGRICRFECSHPVLWMTISKYEVAAVSLKPKILPSADMCQVAGPELMASCCDGLSIAVLGSRFGGLVKLVLGVCCHVFNSRRWSCWGAGALCNFPCHATVVCPRTLLILAHLGVNLWLSGYSLIGSAIIIAIVADAEMMEYRRQC